MSRRRPFVPVKSATLALAAVLICGACVDRKTGASDTPVDAGATLTDQGASGILPNLDAMFPTGGMQAPPQGGDGPSAGGEGGEGPPTGGRPGSGGDPGPEQDAGGVGGTPAMGDPGPCAVRPVDAHGACPASIYEARQDIGLGVAVTVVGVVTAVRRNDDGEPRNFTLQIGNDQPDYFGPNYAAIWVYGGDATASADELANLQEGTTVELTGTTNDFHGQRQLVAVAFVGSRGAAMPIVPLPVEAADIATGGANADGLEGGLVEIYDTEASNAAPAPGEGDREPTNEFEVPGGLRVDDFFYRLEPAAVDGEHFRRVTGIVRFASNLSKLEPRGPADVDRPNPPTPGADMGAPPPPREDSGAPPPPMADMGAPPPPPGDRVLLITEFDYDQMGNDVAEFIEIHNPGDEPVVLAGLNLELVNGANGEVYRRFELADAGNALAAGGFLVVGAAAVTAGLPAGTLHLEFSDVPDLNNSVVQNGPDAVRIATAAGLVLDAVAYEGAVAGASEGDFISGDPADEASESASRCPMDRDSNDNATDFRYAAPSPGTANACD